MKQPSISILHLFLITMTFIGLKNHVTIIPAILQSVGRDGWVSVIFAAFIMGFWLILIAFIHKKSNGDNLSDFLKRQLGKRFGAFINMITAAFLLIISAFTLRETLLWVSTTFLPRTPMLILLFIFCLLVMMTISTSLQTIVIVNIFVLFGVIVLGFFVAFVNMQVKDIELLKPFFEHGFTSAVKGSIYPASGFVELFLLLYLQHHVKGKIHLWHLLIMLVILVGLTMGPLIGAITEFGPIEAAKQRYPAYEEWGLATIGSYIEHLDFFSVYQWLTGAFIRISILLYIAAELMKWQKQKYMLWRYFAPPLFFLSLLLTIFDENAFLDFHEHEFLIFTFCFFFVLSIIYCIAAMLPNKGSESSHDKRDEHVN